MSANKIEFEVSGVAYEAARMNLFTQIAVATKLSPLMANGLVQAAKMVQGLAARGITLKDLPMEELFANLMPLASEVAKIPDEDQRFIIRSCLETVRKNEGTSSAPKWAPVWPVGVAEPMFPEFRTDLALTLKVVGQVVMGNMGGFFFAAL